MKSKANIITIIYTVLLIVITFYITLNNFPQVVQIPTESIIDSTKWVSKATYDTHKDISKEIEKDLSKIIKARDEKITNLIKVNGRLRLQVDTLQSLTDELLKSIRDGQDIVVINDTIRDSTYTFINTYGDSLLAVQSDVILKSNKIYNETTIDQLRDIRLEIINTVNKEQTEVNTYISSKDFLTLKVSTKTTIEPKKRYPWFLIGLGTGVLTTLILIK